MKFKRSLIRILGTGSLVFLAGCGGVQTAATGDLESPAGMGSTGNVSRVVAALPVKIAPVRNLTDDEKLLELAHYLHLKTGEWLEASGYHVVVDDFLAEADLDFLSEALADTATSEEAAVLEVSLVEFEEKAGATVSLGLFSSQSQHAQARVQVRWLDRPDATVEREATNAKGAWGAVAKVNRDTLNSKEGFWAFDHSLAGGAAGAALREALAALVAEYPARRDAEAEPNPKSDTKNEIQ
ncbi:MAG: hypothetical protein SynsKO_28700 [Synoicihabitans sp.]